MAQPTMLSVKRHGREDFFVRGEGIFSLDAKGNPTLNAAPSQDAERRKFLFSRLGLEGPVVPRAVLEQVAPAMTANGPQTDLPDGAGYTYLGQFLDHDLTLDKTAAKFDDSVTIAELKQGRSPALDLDSLYGGGPTDPDSSKFYEDGATLKLGRTTGVPNQPKGAVPLDGHDLPRVGVGSTRAERIRANIPDVRNDENLAVAQVHVAMINFHNRVVADLAAGAASSMKLFETARETVTKHYQWMVRHDYLPRIADVKVIDDVFTNGRQFFEVDVPPGDMPTMPIEFSVAAFRLGHSMIRSEYQWNAVFQTGGLARASLAFLFQFSGTSGNFDPSFGGIPEDKLPPSITSNWVADWRRLFDFTGIDPALAAPAGSFNVAHQIDTLLVDPLATLPLGSFGGAGTSPPAIEFNLAFRNLARANMVKLATGQQMAQLLGVAPLSSAEIAAGKKGAKLTGLAKADLDAFVSTTPLWFYILREAEVKGGGKLTGVGARIVAEVFHRAIEGSQNSIVRDPAWRPTLGPRPGTFEMPDLIFHAFRGDPVRLNPMGN